MTTLHRRTVLILLALLWLLGAWATRDVDSDTGTPTSAPLVWEGSGAGQAWRGAEGPAPVAAGGVTSSASPAASPTRASRHRHTGLPWILLRIRWCESRNDYRAENPTSTASGAYQFTRGSWRWYGHAARYGVPEAYLATPAQQDEAALITYRRSGLSPWAASRRCWR